MTDATRTVQDQVRGWLLDIWDCIPERPRYDLLRILDGEG